MYILQAIWHMSIAQNYLILFFPASFSISLNLCCLDMSAIDATFGIAPIVTCCGRVFLDSHPPCSIGCLLERIVEILCQTDCQSPIPKDLCAVSIESFMFGARLVHEGDMILVASVSVT